MPAFPLLAIAFAVSLAGQPRGADLYQDKRHLLESERRALLAQVEDPAWMQDQGRATLARLSVERGWKECAENEAAAVARESEKPARLVAERALATCQQWEDLLRLALDKGAYPYLNGQVSKDDMVMLARLESRDRALARISMWRGGSPVSAMESRRADDEEKTAPPPVLPRPTPSPPTAPPPAEAEAAKAPEEEGETIVVTATRLGGCRVRLADKTLSERELEANAKQWAANGTPLRVVRPAGADYHCLARIVWSLNKYGVTLFHFVEPSEAR